MAYPNVPQWNALAQGRRVPVDGDRHYLMSVVDCGSLIMPTGRLVACDPSFGFRDGREGFFQVPLGRYRVRATLADVSDANDGSHVRVAYASLMLDEAAEEVTRRIIVPPAKGTCPPEIGADEVFRGFGVDAGTACFVDDGAIADSLRDKFWERVFDNGRRDGGLSLMDSTKHLRKGLANFPLPDAPGGGNMIAFESGWGDGIYPVVGGYDASGRLVRVHIDFFVVSPFLRRRETIIGRALHAVHRVVERLRGGRLGVDLTNPEPRRRPGSGETASYPVLPLRDTVVLPGMIIPLYIGRERSVAAIKKAMREDSYILLATQKDPDDDDPAPDSIYSVGTLGSVLQLLSLPDGTAKVLIEAFGRAEIRRWSVQPDCYEAETITVAGTTDGDTAALARTAFNMFATYVKLTDPEIEREEGDTELFVDLQEVKELTDPDALADRIASYIAVPNPEKQDILATAPVSTRLRKLLTLLEREIALRSAG